MIYDLALKLKEASFPQNKQLAWVISPYSKKGERSLMSMTVDNEVDSHANLLKAGYEVLACPNSDELIEELGEKFGGLVKHKYPGTDGMIFSAVTQYDPLTNIKRVETITPLEALAELYIAVNKK